MTISMHSIQTTEVHWKNERSAQPPKSLQTQTATQKEGSRDTVTISQESRQALASNTKQASGDNH